MQTFQQEAAHNPSDLSEIDTLLNASKKGGSCLATPYISPLPFPHAMHILYPSSIPANACICREFMAAHDSASRYWAARHVVLLATL